MKPFVTTCILLSTVLAHAESLEEQKFWKTQTNYIDKELEIASDACGKKFTFAWVDKPTFRDETAKSKHSPMGVCTALVHTVVMICRDGETEKAAVKAKISGLACGFAHERSLDMKGGVVTYMGNNKQANFNDWAQPWLLKHL